MRFPSASSTGRIWLSNRPSAVARAARSCDCSPKASISAREMPHFSAIISAEMPCGTSPPTDAYRAPSLGPNGKPYLPSSIEAPIGTRVMTSTPAATTTS